MKLFVCDSNKINSYQLPDKVEDFYMINYLYDDTSSQISVTLKAENGRWIIKSDESVAIYSDGMIVNEAALDDYASYQVKFSDLDFFIYIQIMPDIEPYAELSIQNLSTITIGN